MSVAANSPLTSANTNGAFVSRTQNTDMVGTLDILNPTDATSTGDGSLHTEGGIGVEKTAYINQVVVESLSGDQALITSSTKEVIESVTTAAELAFMSGVTSNVQTQLDGKANDSSVVHNTGTETVNGLKTFTNNLTASADLSVGGNAVITGNLTVNGTTTTVNSATLDVTDTNITVNNGGNNALSEGAGLTVDRTGTSGSLIYGNALASRFAIGDLGSESEILSSAAVQTVSGQKTFSGKLIASGELDLAETVDASSTGSNAIVPTLTPSVRLTNASLVSIGNIDDVTNGKVVILSNDTGAAITLVNDASGTAIKRILTGTGGDMAIQNQTTVILSYDSVSSRWSVIGGSATGVGGPGVSIDSEMVLFNGTSGSLLKRATGSGFVKTTSGVYGTQASIALGTDVSGTLPVANGGTGQTSYTDGQILIGDSSGNTLVKSTITQGAGITVTNGGGTITIASTLGTSVDLTSEVNGTLPVASGGTGQTTYTAAYNALSPSTTKGDVEVHNGTDVIRVAVGTNGQFLTADSTQASGVKWSDYSVTDVMINQTAGDTIGTTNSLIKFTSTENDPGSNYASGTGKFTAPSTRTYTVSWNVVSAAVTLSTTQRLYANLYKNGAFYKFGSRANGTGGSNNYQSGGCLASVKLTAGDTLEVRADSSVATTASSAAGDCYFSIRG